MSKKRNKYKIRSLIVDTILVCLTGPLWVIRIFVREQRRKN